MSQSFDPYHIWLGIRPEEQPPNHYRLLGITLFEDNTEAIRDATEQRMAHVRSYQLGPHSALSQKILNELASAKGCLLDPKRKATYDDRLRSQAVEDSPSPSARPLGSLNKRGLALAGIVAVVLVIAVVLIVAMSSRKGGQPDETPLSATSPITKNSTTKVEDVDADSKRLSPQPRTEQVVAKDTETPQPKPAEVASTPAMAPAATSSPEPPPTTTPPASSTESLPQAKARLEKAVKEAKTPSEFQSLGSEALLLAESAFKAGDAETGKALATVAVGASRSSGDTDLMRKSALVFLGIEPTPQPIPQSVPPPATGLKEVEAREGHAQHDGSMRTEVTLPKADPKLPDGAILILTFEPRTFRRQGQTFGVRDLSESNQRGEIRGATIVEGKVGKALAFNGQSDVLVSGKYPSKNSPRTVCAWVRSVAEQHDGHIRTPIIYGSPSPRKAFGLCEDKGRIWGLCGWYEDVYSEKLVDREWHHHALLYDGSQAMYYFDGERTVEKSMELDTPPGPVFLGSFNSGNAFKGAVDEVVVFDRSLNPDEIRTVYEFGVSGRNLK